MARPGKPIFSVRHPDGSGRNYTVHSLGLAVHLASVPDGLPLLKNAVVPVGSSCAHAARDRLQAGTVEARSFSAPPKATHCRAKVVCTIVVAVTVALAGFEPGFDEPIEPASPGPVHIDILEIRLAPLSVLDVRLERHRGTLPPLHSPRTVALADHVRAGTPPGAFGPLAAPHLHALMFVVGVALACLLASEAQASAVNLGRQEHHRQPLRCDGTAADHPDLHRLACHACGLRDKEGAEGVGDDEEGAEGGAGAEA